MSEWIDWGAARVIWEIISALSVLIFTAGIWWLRRSSASAAAIRDVHDRIDGVERHVERVEHTVDHMPGRSDIEGLQQTMAETNRQLAEMRATGNAQKELLDRIHTYLFNERGNR